MAYQRVNWENEPSTATPITANNLNRMDSALKDQDSRITSLTPVQLIKARTYSTGWKSGEHEINSTHPKFDDFEFVEIYAIDDGNREYFGKVTFPDKEEGNDINTTFGTLWGFNVYTPSNSDRFGIYEKYMEVKLSGRKFTIVQNRQIIQQFSKSDYWTGDGNQPFYNEVQTSVSKNYGALGANSTDLAYAPLAVCEIVGWWR